MVGRQLVPPSRGDLVRRGGVLTVRAEGGPTASTAPVSFGATVVTWDDLPRESQRVGHLRSPLVAESVSVDGTLLLDGGRQVEHATGWRFYEDGVVLVEVVRPVLPTPAGGRKTGSWKHRRAVTRRAASTPRRRRGVVPVADDLVPRGGGGGSAGAVAPDAPLAWAYLPAIVRTQAERLVPDATLWLGELTQQGVEGFPRSQSISAVRLSADRAVAVVATRTLAPIPGAGVEVHVAEMARIPWLVEQVGLDLGEVTERARIGPRRA